MKDKKSGERRYLFLNENYFPQFCKLKGSLGGGRLCCSNAVCSVSFAVLTAIYVYVLFDILLILRYVYKGCNH